MGTYHCLHGYVDINADLESVLILSTAQEPAASMAGLPHTGEEILRTGLMTRNF